MSDETLDHYRLIRLLGRGGMGEVHLAEDVRLGRKVALKLLNPELAKDPEALKRFGREARAAAELSHPAIATLYDLGPSTERPFLAMEYIEGETLSQKTKKGPLPVGQVVHIGAAIADGLAHAHAHGVVHRDIKGENLMLDGSGQIKILDFGLARLEDATRLTKPGSRMGTISHMSPEQLEGREVDHRTDVWSLGVVLYDMLVGALPFERESWDATATAIMTQSPEPVTGRRTGIPVEIERIVLKCLDKDPARRYQSMQELAVDLRRVSAEADTVIRPTRSSRRSPRRWVSIGAPLVAVVAVAVFLLVQPGESVPFNERDWILLADFDNRTGDSELDHTLQAGLEVSLHQSRYVNVYPRKLVRETIARMERDPSIGIDEEVGMEVAQRESIPILVACSISQLEDEYSLVARIIDPDSGVALRTEAVRASGRDEILDRLDDLAGRIRAGLGESLADISNQRIALPKATTSSLQALKDFADGELAFGERRFRAAFAAFSSAVERDSTFALAHARLGACYAWSGEMRRGNEHFRRALELEGRLTHREQLYLHPYIDGWRGNRESAIEGFLTYLENYPDDSFAWFQMGYQYMLLGRCGESIEALNKSLEFNPRDAAAHVNIATCYTKTGQFALAIEHYELAFADRPDWRKSSNINHEFGFAQVQLGEISAAEETFRLMLDDEDVNRASGCRSMGLLSMYRGRYGEAVDWLEQGVRLQQSLGYRISEARNRMFLATAHHRRGDNRAEHDQLTRVRQMFEQDYPGSNWVQRVGTGLARAGDHEGLEAMLALLEQNENPEIKQDRAALERLRGEVLLEESGPAAAIGPLEMAYTVSRSTPDGFAIARALHQAGELQEALRRYNEVLAENALGWEALDPWLAAHYWLGRLHEELDDAETASHWYGRLLEIWRDGDPGLPLRVEAERRRDAIEAGQNG